MLLGPGGICHDCDGGWCNGQSIKYITCAGFCPQASAARDRGAAEPRGPGGIGEGRQGGGPAGIACRVLAGPWAGSGRAAAGPGGVAGAGAGADPARADAGVPVHLLPGRGAADGGGPGRHARLRAAGAAVRRRAPVQFRRVRLAGAEPGLRRQRLRRDPARPVRVGRQAAGREPGGGRTGQRLSRQGPAQDRPGGGRRLPDGDARVRRRSPSWTSGTRTWTSSRPSPNSGPRSRRKGSRKPRSCWPRPTPGTAPRHWAS